MATVVHTLNLPVASPILPAEAIAPQIKSSTNRRYLLFDDTTPETCYWQFRMPANYTSGLTAKIQYTMASATTGKVDFEVSVMAVSDGDGADVETDSFDTVNSGSATVPGTAGLLDEISITLTNADGVVAGDLVLISLARDADDGTNDTATGDAEVLTMTIQYDEVT